jgi:hypothetical protein
MHGLRPSMLAAPEAPDSPSLPARAEPSAGRSSATGSMGASKAMSPRRMHEQAQYEQNELDRSNLSLGATPGEAAAPAVEQEEREGFDAVFAADGGKGGDEPRKQLDHDVGYIVDDSVEIVDEKVGLLAACGCNANAKPGARRKTIAERFQPGRATPGGPGGFDPPWASSYLLLHGSVMVKIGGHLPSLPQF